MEGRLQGEFVHIVPAAHRLVQEIAKDNSVGTRNMVGFGLRSPLLAAGPPGRLVADSSPARKALHGRKE